MRTQYSGLIDDKYIGQTVTLYGWAHRRRDHGGVIFIDLRDREGLVQIVCDPDRPEVFETADKVRNEFVLEVTGLVRARPEGTRNENLISGGVEVLAQDLKILNLPLLRPSCLTMKPVGNYSSHIPSPRPPPPADAAQHEASLQGRYGLPSSP